MSHLITSGVTPDGLFNGSISLIVGLGSIILSIVLSLVDRRAARTKRDKVASDAQKRIEELSDRMDRQRENELTRISGMYESQLAEKERNLKYWQRRALEKGDTDD